MSSDNVLLRVDNLNTAASNACVFPGKQWEAASPESQDVNAEKLDKAMKFLGSISNSDGVRGAMVIRNGYCIWQGDEIDREHDIRSCTKSITGTIFGLMIDERLCSLDTLAMEYHKELAEEYPQVKLSHFASMTSGYNSVGALYGGDGKLTDGGLTPWIPREPVYTPPGKYFHYHDNAMREFGYILSIILKQPLEEYFREKVAKKIGMRRWYWTDYLANDRGNDPASSFYTSASEFARLGLLYLNNGVWEGSRILSEGWINQATASQTKHITDYFGYFYRGLEGAGCYGYNWWTYDYATSDEKKIPHLPKGSYHAIGYNNNHLWVIPTWNMVIVRCGTDGSVKPRWQEFFKLLSEAIY